MAKKKKDKDKTEDLLDSVIRAATRRPRASTRRRKTPTGRMPRFAARVERLLDHHSALPKRISDRSVIGDLAALEWRLALIDKALREFVGTRHGDHSSRLFAERLMLLKSEIDSMAEVCADLKGPMERLLKRKCGVEGLAAAALRGASSSLRGFD